MAQRSILGPTGQPLPLGIGRAVAAMAGGSREIIHDPTSARAQALGGWHAPQTSADGAWLWNRDDTVAKVRELLATEPWAQGGIDRKVDMIVGASWRPSIKPDAEALGITEEEAAAAGDAIERHGWRGWADDPLCRCDLEETLNGSWLLHLMVMEQEVSGDGVGVLRWREDRGWPYRTALQVIDADRLSNPMQRADRPDLHGGIEFHPETGAPVAYHFRNAHPGDLYTSGSRDAYTWTRVERREPWGRPKVLHLFGKHRPGQSRGISKLVAGLARFKQLQRFADSELANAVINALFAATITSSFDPAVAQQHLSDTAVAGYQTLRSDYYSHGAPTMGGARVQHLFPGDTLDFKTTPRATAAFESFSTVFLRSVASCLGVAYEQIAMDWSKVNYSSARAALVEVWRGIMRARSMVAMMVATPLLLAVAEDALDAGLFELPAHAPGLYEAPAAWLRGRWIGPARGWVDPVKEPLGAAMQIELGVNNWDDVSADQGLDFDMNLAALKSNRDAWQASGMVPPALATMLMAAAAPPTEDERLTPAGA